MDYRTTSFSRPARRRSGGFTLAEVLVAIAIASILATVLIALSLYAARSFAGIANYLELQKDSRLALDLLTRDIRQARALSAWSTNQLVFQDFDDRELIFAYSPSTRTLTKSKDGETKVLLRGCDFLEFSIFQRTPVAGSMVFHPATSAASCKLIQIRWLCSRSISGTSMNTVWVQTAKVVIRKKKASI